ncbi:hypothetical protein [Homoserinibacter sp. GY 40078]|uniref:hypothetical protein n=1 Tax=Homoserinibacter sp. GY 40078 TaxID=2603275 RepID=UPI0011C80773|nr:hypothetical protein [Homoserinibacter sp. GY 40078]TXK17389.1 hypothetical protein FVQ89_11180 [Homoserinibacter sp. GY 40078]
MDRGNTYGLPGTAERASLFLPLTPSGLRDVFDPPEEITVTRRETGELLTFVLLDERTLECGDVQDGNGACKSWDCHRMRLGKCLCGRHQNAPGTPDDERPIVRIRRAS